MYNQNHLVRNIKIYHLIGIGDSKTIKLSNYLDISFDNLRIHKNKNDSIYYKNDLPIFKIVYKDNHVWVNYYSVWNNIQHTLLSDSYEHTHDIIYYTINKKYNLTPNYIGHHVNLL